MERERRILEALKDNTLLVEYLEIVKNKIADVRVSFPYGEDTRRATIRAIDDFILTPIRTGSQKIRNEEDSYR